MILKSTINNSISEIRLLNQEAVSCQQRSTTGLVLAEKRKTLTFGDCLAEVFASAGRPGRIDIDFDAGLNEIDAYSAQHWHDTPVDASLSY